MKESAAGALRYARKLVRRKFKYLRLRLSCVGADRREPHPAFVFGCHRSGTKMLLQSLDRSMETWVYPEHNRHAFDDEFRLRSLERTAELVRRSPAPVVVFKPICESHLADCILDRFSGQKGALGATRALWIYRDYRDVANSLVRKWGDHLRAVMQAIQDGRSDEVGWRGERLGENRVRKLRDLCPPKHLSRVDAAALFWWLRNGFFFELGLNTDPRVRAVSYDRLVQRPTEYLRPVFRFLGLDFNPSFGGHIHANSVGTRVEPEISPSVREACLETFADLEKAHRTDRQ